MNPPWSRQTSHLLSSYCVFLQVLNWETWNFNNVCFQIDKKMLTSQCMLFCPSADDWFGFQLVGAFKSQ